MDPVSAKKFNLDCFNRFKQSPKDASIEVVKGVHKFLAQAIKNPKNSPTCGELIKIFHHFSSGQIKDYVYNRMTKKVVLELALCVVQEILLNGIGRAKTLELELVKTKYGGKTVKIADPFRAERDDFDEAFLGKIDEAFFCIKDSEGLSPDVNLAAGLGHKAPYSPFGKDGGFVRPKPPVVRSLEASIEVNFLPPFFLSVGSCLKLFYGVA